MIFTAASSGGKMLNWVVALNVISKSFLSNVECCIFHHLLVESKSQRRATRTHWNIKKVVRCLNSFTFKFTSINQCKLERAAYKCYILYNSRRDRLCSCEEKTKLISLCVCFHHHQKYIYTKCAFRLYLLCLYTQDEVG